MVALQFNPRRLSSCFRTIGDEAGDATEPTLIDRHMSASDNYLISHGARSLMLSSFDLRKDWLSSGVDSNGSVDRGRSI